MFTDSNNLPLLPDEEEEHEKQPFASSLIDTIRVKLNMPHKLIASLHASGLKPRGNRFTIKGAFGLTATIESWRSSNHVFIEASPKFLTGQNLIGIEDVHKLATEIILKVLDRAEIVVNRALEGKVRGGGYFLQRVDLVAHCDCGSADRLHATIRALKRLLADSAFDVSFYGYETIYIGQHSRYWTIKIYDKSKEMLVRPLSDELHQRDFLNMAAENVLRFEVVLRAPALQDLGLSHPLSWTSERVRDILQEKYDELLSQVHGIAFDLGNASKLPPSCQTKYSAWVLGDASAFRRSPTTHDANRKVVMQTLGIDIASPFDLQAQRDAVLPVRQVLERGLVFKEHPKAWKILLAAARRVERKSLRHQFEDIKALRPA